MGESISTIQRSPRLSTSYKFAAPRYRLLPMALQTVQKIVEPRLSTAFERLLSRAVVSKTKSLRRLCNHVSNSVVFVHRAGTLAKGYPTAIQAVLKGRIVAIRKGNKHQLGLFFLLEACQEMLLGHPQQADQWTQSFPFPIVIHQSLDPAARALKRQAPCLYMHSSARQAQNASTRRVDAPSR